jgi:hypothetical protein
MKALIPFDNGDYAVNVYGQDAKIIDIANDEVVFRWLHDGSTDVMSVDEFDEHFEPIKEVEEQQSPTRKKDYQ